MNVYYSNDSFEEKCECGCVFRVDAPQLDGHNEKEEYKCPKCYKEYKIKAAITPRTTIILCVEK